MSESDKERGSKERTVGIEKVSQALNVGPRRIQQLVIEGMPRADRGKYDLAKCMLWYIRFLQTSLSERHSPKGLQDERERLTRAQADREELELARARGEVIPIQTYEEQEGAQIMAVRQQLLGLPSRLAPQLEGEDRRVIKTKLDAALRATLTSLSRSNNNGGGGPGTGSPETTGRSRRKAGGAVGAPAKSKDKRVGRKKPDSTKGNKR